MGLSKIIIRAYRPGDCPELLKLLYDTVHTICARDYSPEQLEAWADGKPDMTQWERSFLEHDTLVAELGGVTAGFGDITAEGYLDRLYVHRDYQGLGIATALCDRLEAGHSPITTYASITAKPFFLKRGYRVVRENRVVRHNIELINYLMEKHTNLL